MKTHTTSSNPTKGSARIKREWWMVSACNDEYAYDDECSMWFFQIQICNLKLVVVLHVTNIKNKAFRHSWSLQHYVSCAQLQSLLPFWWCHFSGCPRKPPCDCIQMPRFKTSRILHPSNDTFLLVVMTSYQSQLFEKIWLQGNMYGFYSQDKLKIMTLLVVEEFHKCR